MKNIEAPEFVGKSGKIEKVFKLIQHLSSTRATVFIQGESGTGKELIANIIHQNSPVADGPLIKVNCSALAQGVIESELFGHERGAFTGALSQKKGRFELADGGTLFLDEVGDLPLHVQVKILRFLQESEFERVGGTGTLRVNVRIISATHKNLEELVREEKFRADLLYRLKVVSLTIPPLREREEDIDILLEHHLKRFAKMHNKNIDGISPDAMEIIRKHSWPGNVRELMNCLESSVVTTQESYIDKKSLPPSLLPPVVTSACRRKDLNGFTLKACDSPNGVDKNSGTQKTSLLPLFEIEKRAILDAFSKTGRNKVLAAKRLGIATSTLYRKLESYGVQCSAGHG